MTIRAHFDQQLTELSNNILLMGSRVQEELRLVLDAYNKLDVEKATEVFALDREVNKARFEIEERCFSLIVTQQPAARDLRTIMTAMSIIVDLERMGDQAKGIAKVIPHLRKQLDDTRSLELRQMGELAIRMVDQVMLAYAHNNTDLARIVANMDEEMDTLYARFFGKIMVKMADAVHAEQAETTYELLRVARELERFGDLATNVAERIIYQVTGSYQEINVDRNEEVGGLSPGVTQ